MSTGIDLSAWMTKAEAAAILGCSERTLDRLAAAGMGPERRLRPRQGAKPEPVYNPADVERLAPAAAPAVVFGPPDPHHFLRGGAPPLPATRPTANAGVELLVSAMQTLADRVGPRRPMAAFLTIKEASAYSGLSQAFLRRLVRSGTLPAVLDGAIKVRRADLDNLANFDTISPMSKLPESGSGRAS